MRRAAGWLSVLLHPVFMPLYTLALAMRVDPHLAWSMPEQARWITLAMVAVMTVAFPLTSTLLLLRAGILSDLQMHRKEERIAPFVMTLLYLTMTWYLLRQSPLHPVALSIFAGIAVTLFLATVITFFWKISIHMVGIAGMLGVIAGISVKHALPLLPVIAMLIVLTGLLGTARLIAGTHAPAQIYAGTAVGFVITYSFVVLETGY
jgi:hypothetical protein